ncbi:MAG: outer membrane lipoprotein-sorting protein [Marivirga sp.]|jgi:outer membrane lipoprotein-sorting protein
MKHLKSLICLFLLAAAPLMAQNADDILQKIDQNMEARTTIMTSKMIIYGKRATREVISKNYAEGNNKAFTEYLAPDREKGTKMLKLADKLWIYNPATDRTIQLSGHMLRQSVMGSDLSYEDMMEERSMQEVYDAKILGEETINGRACWLLELKAKVADISYQQQKIWVDKARYVPLRQELYAKSGQLLKQINNSEISQVEGRWYPKRVNYKDMLKGGKGTDFVIIEITFNPPIAEYIFNKASLKR